MKKFVGILVVGLFMSPVFAQNSEIAINDTEELIQNDMRELQQEIAEFKLAVSQLLAEIQYKKEELSSINNEIKAAKAELNLVRDQMNAVTAAALTVAKNNTEPVATATPVVKNDVSAAPAAAKDTAVTKDTAVAKGDKKGTTKATKATKTTKAKKAKGETFVISDAEIAAAVPEKNTTPVKNAKTTKGQKNPGAASIGVLQTVYFEPDSTKLLTSYKSTIENIVGTLKENPNMQITIRGYSAPFGTEAGQIAVSKGRAMNCADYLLTTFKIPSEQVKIDWVGAKQKPKTAVETEVKTQRAVEFILGESYV
ncbi:MAG: hypothetical protein Ta2F_16900 [Termitinemataceae bacterium]|nr:MAG: hypothetical protein Ta2F_16900 [Termitinemataceae bacterium]